MLQGVEHTDPTEWSNSHLSIGDKFMLTVLRQLILFRTMFCFFSDGSAHFISDGSATFYFRRFRNISFYCYGIRTEMVVTYMDTLYYNGLFLEQLETQGTIFQLAYNNTIYYTLKPDGLLVSRF